MRINIFEGILIPFVGTTLGAACVFFMRKTLSIVSCGWKQDRADQHGTRFQGDRLRGILSV